MNDKILKENAEKMMSKPKGLLAMDESLHLCKRLQELVLRTLKIIEGDIESYSYYP